MVLVCVGALGCIARRYSPAVNAVFAKYVLRVLHVFEKSGLCCNKGLE